MCAQLRHGYLNKHTLHAGTVVYCVCCWCGRQRLTRVCFSFDLNRFIPNRKLLSCVLYVHTANDCTEHFAICTRQLKIWCALRFLFKTWFSLNCWYRRVCFFLFVFHLLAAHNLCAWTRSHLKCFSLSKGRRGRERERERRMKKTNCDVWMTWFNFCSDLFFPLLTSFHQWQQQKLEMKFHLNVVTWTHRYTRRETFFILRHRVIDNSRENIGHKIALIY